jgi:Zn-dependent protease
LWKEGKRIMLRSWKIGSAFGIGIYLHWSFLFLLAWVMLNASGPNVLTSALFSGGLLVAVFACVLLHEFGHALTARYFGIRTRSVTLYIIGGVARLERMSEKPLQELLIAIAGPAVNVVIAGLLFVVLAAWYLIDPQGLVITLQPPPWNVPSFLFALMLMNGVVLVLFNHITALPMDGGRVLRALLAFPMGIPRATEIVVPIGIVVGVVSMTLLSVISHSFMPMLVCLFVFLAGQQELMAVRMKARQREGSMEVLPVVKPINPLSMGPTAVLDLRPIISVYTWDPNTGLWIRESDPRGRRAY